MVVDVAILVSLVLAAVLGLGAWLWVIVAEIRRNGWRGLRLFAPWLWLKYVLEEPHAKRAGLVYMACMAIIMFVPRLAAMRGG